MSLGSFLDFVVEFRDGDGALRTSTIRSLGVMLDGDDVVMFNQPPGERVVGARIPLARIERISTDAAPRSINDGMPPWRSPDT
jgi:hypothetical protein